MIINQTGLPDTLMTPHELYGDMYIYMLYYIFFVNNGFLGYDTLPLDGILSLTPNPLRLG